MEKKMISHPGDPDFKYFDDEEKDLIEGIEAEADKFEPLPKEERERILASFRTSSAAGRRSVTVRLEQHDLEALKQAAEREGMPYQTLLGSVIHKYVSGTLVDLNEARKLMK